MTNEGRAGIDVGGLTVGLIFIVLGVAFLLDRLDVWTLDLGVVWPVVLIALGVAILVGGVWRRSRAGG